MNSLFNKHLKFFLKLTGFWPGNDHTVKLFILASVIFGLTSFHFIQGLNLAENFLQKMDNLGDAYVSLLVWMKFFVLWTNRRLQNNFVDSKKFIRIYLNYEKIYVLDFTFHFFQKYKEFITACYPGLE